MANKNVPNAPNAAGGIVAAVTLIATVIHLAKPAFDVIEDKLEKRKEELKELIDIPTFYAKGISIDLDRAVFRLEELGFKVETVEIRDAHVRYRNCFSQQVIGTRPQKNQKAKPNSLVYVRFVTADIIERSQALYEETEKRKAELKLARDEKRRSQQEKAKLVIHNAAGKIRTPIKRNKTDDA